MHLKGTLVLQQAHAGNNKITIARFPPFLLKAVGFNLQHLNKHRGTSLSSLLPSLFTILQTYIMSGFGIPICPRSPPHLLEPSFIHPFTVQKRKSLASNRNTISNESAALQLFDNLVLGCGTPEAAFLTLISKYSIDLDVLQRIGGNMLSYVAVNNIAATDCEYRDETGVLFQ